jgi:hypothetical protein
MLELQESVDISRSILYSYSSFQLHSLQSVPYFLILNTIFFLFLFLEKAMLFLDTGPLHMLLLLTKILSSYLVLFFLPHINHYFHREIFNDPSSLSSGPSFHVYTRVLRNHYLLSYSECFMTSETTVVSASCDIPSMEHTVDYIKHSSSEE